jgi:hypothetical protein
MSHRIYPISVVTVAIFGTALAIGCGSDDDKGSGSAAPSYQDLSAKVQQPTGTVDATTVGPVAQEYASMNSASFNGSRDYAESGTTTEACTASGNMTASGTGNENAANVSIDYNDCCETASCCYDGTMHMVYSDDGGGSMSYCADYAVEYACEGVNMSVNYAMCTQANGTVGYSVEVAGETYTVSGNYIDGNGQLTITGANGSWTCSYTNDTGTCTGTGGDFTF